MWFFCKKILSAYSPYFPTFQFDDTFAKKVYELMRNWALDNKPIPLDEFLKERNVNTNVIEN